MGARRSTSSLVSLARIAALAIPVLLAAGCAAKNNRPVSPPASAPAWIVALEDGVDGRDDLLLQIGSPSGEFEGGNILTWRLDHRFRVVGEWEKTRFNLVLEFDDAGVLRRHGLVRLK